MAVITTPLPQCAFLEDLPDIKISQVDAQASVTVIFDRKTIVSNALFTSDKQKVVTIYAKQMIRNMVSLVNPNLTRCQPLLPVLQVEITVENVKYSTSCLVAPGGTSKAEVITNEWFTKNFLTWQPQVIETTWEQPQWLCFIHTPFYDWIQIYSRLYTKDGNVITQRLFDSYSDSDYSFWQIPTDFKSLWAAQCNAHSLDPFCYEIYGMAGNYTDGQEAPVVYSPRPMIQRYVLRPDQYNDVCFAFENTLGGFDTLMLQGKLSYQPEGDITSFKNFSTEKELINDYTSIWEANTGRIETEREAGQFQDFLKSRNRYVLINRAWKRIVVTEYKIKHTRGESNSYTLKYHLADKNENRYFERTELQEPLFPATKFFPEDR